jgi:hypothetical protein
MITYRVYIIASLFFTEGTSVPFFHRNRVWIPIPLEGTAGNTHSFLSVVVYVNKNKCVEQPTIKALSLVESNGFWQWYPAIRLFTMRRSA